MSSAFAAAHHHSCCCCYSAVSYSLLIQLTRHALQMLLTPLLLLLPFPLLLKSNNARILPEILFAEQNAGLVSIDSYVDSQKMSKKQKLSELKTSQKPEATATNTITDGHPVHFQRWLSKTIEFVANTSIASI